MPGKSGKSELIRRINAAEADERMPPPKTKRKLTAEQKDALRCWVDQGAVWNRHWAYEAPARLRLPAVQNPHWPRNPIDYFILARLEHEGLLPSSEAARETLIRRASLDLTGIPPTPGEVDAFRADHSPTAYEKLVDRLLASQRYGERMAMDWLDGARFADTNGYQNDFARSMWPWRDWVIAAYNANMPFDRFLTEQIAGDLLPHPTLQQRIATGFNRNNRTVTEAGSIDEEWRIENAVDRVETTSMVFLGLTMGCARCHDHKYDPIRQKEFYQFLAFFNSIDERGVYTEQPGNVPPLVKVPTPENGQRLKDLDRAIAVAEQAVQKQESLLPERQKRWEQELRNGGRPSQPKDWALHLALSGDLKIGLAGNQTADATYRGKGRPVWNEGPFGKALALDGQESSWLDGGQAVQLERDKPFSYGGWVKPRGSGALLSKIDDQAAYRGFDLLLQNGKIQVHLVHTWPDNAIKIESLEPLPEGAWSHVLVTYDGSSKASGIIVYVNGQPVKDRVDRDGLSQTTATSQPFRIGKRSRGYPLQGELTDIRVYKRTLASAEVEAAVLQSLLPILRKPSAQRTPAQQELLARIFRKRFALEWREARTRAEKLRQEKADYGARIPTVMVMLDQPKPRPTYLLKRGRYDMPDTSRKLEPDVPGCLPKLGSGLPRNRLGLARWLVDPANPLTARVTVNRFWQHYFGTGVLKTTENFGVQGEPPSHPELLDWLATELIRTGWDVKAMQKLIVTSATYRQSSNVKPTLLGKDPDNRLLARGPRFRLSGEAVRDNALAISGLLVDRVGGPSVKPYQPAGLWEELAGGAGEGPYVQDMGPNLYRRSLYIYRKRTVPHPAMATFDAPSREICQVKRAITNTPLQALELLNDVAYVEAARRLAQLMLAEGGNRAEDRLISAFRRATARWPEKAELQALLRGLERYRQMFRNDPEAARRLVHHGDSSVDERLDPAELAAYTAAAGVILNLDETITKE
jgi:hypothetical protein